MDFPFVTGLPSASLISALWFSSLHFFFIFLLLQWEKSNNRKKKDKQECRDGAAVRKHVWNHEWIRKWSKWSKRIFRASSCPKPGDRSNFYEFSMRFIYKFCFIVHLFFSNSLSISTRCVMRWCDGFRVLLLWFLFLLISAICELILGKVPFQSHSATFLHIQQGSETKRERGSQRNVSYLYLSFKWHLLSQFLILFFLFWANYRRSWVSTDTFQDGDNHFCCGFAMSTWLFQWVLSYSLLSLDFSK